MADITSGRIIATTSITTITVAINCLVFCFIITPLYFTKGNTMPKLILPYFLIICGILGILRARSTKRDKRAREEYLNRESLANETRKADISTLPYIKISDNILNYTSADEEVNRLLSEVKALGTKKILNLTGISNTDLKLKYGAANLPELTECDENFTSLCKTIFSIGKLLYEKEDIDNARLFLEYGVSIKSDITDNYVLLATIYESLGLSDRIEDLKQIASTLNSLSKETIIHKLDALVHN